MPENRFYQDRTKWEKPQAPDPVIIEDFYKSGKIPKDDLFDGTARRIAESFYIPTERIGVGKTQLRRLFNEVKHFDQNLGLAPEQWEEQKPFIKMINSKLSYNIARAVERNGRAEGVYKNLRSFVEQGLQLATAEGADSRDYHVFAELFEAVYGFYYEINHAKD